MVSSIWNCLPRWSLRACEARYVFDPIVDDWLKRLAVAAWLAGLGPLAVMGVSLRAHAGAPLSSPPPAGGQTYRPTRLDLGRLTDNQRDNPLFFRGREEFCRSTPLPLE